MQSITIAQEAILQQVDNKLGPDLTTAITNIRKDTKSLTNSKLSKHSLAKIVKEHTGITATFKLRDHGVATTIPKLDAQNPIMAHYGERRINQSKVKKLLDKSNRISGVVDLSTGKVHGVFTELNVTIYVARSMLSQGSIYTANSVAAFILHELGHSFIYMELVGRLTTTNFVMEEATRSLLGAPTTAQRVEVMSKAAIALDGKVDTSKSLDKPRTADQYRMLIFDMARESAISETGVDIYDMRNFEQLADLYVSRMGYGRHLAVGLDQLFRAYGESEYRSKVNHYTIQLAKLMLISVTPFVILIPMLILYNPLKDLYEPPQLRFKAIRKQQLNILKNRDIEPAIREEAIDSIATIDKLLSNMQENIGPWDFAYKYLTPKGRREHSEMDRQRFLESLASNDLYLTAATL